METRKVDQAALVADPETAVLGHAALGDIELAHDLDAGKDGLVMLARNGRHGGLQHAVDAVLHMQAVVVGLEVNIGSAALERGEDGGVDQPDDRADVFFRGQLLDRDVFVGIVVGRDHVEGQPFGGLVEHALRLLGLLEQVGDLRERRDRVMMRWPSRPLISSSTISRLGSLTAITRRSSCCSSGTKL
jgi:hypothetical protein